MMTPKVVAFVSGVAALFLAYSIFGPSSEAPSRAVTTMNWIFLGMAVVACVGSIIQMMKMPGEPKR